MTGPFPRVILTLPPITWLAPRPQDAATRAAADKAGEAVMTALNRNAVKLALPALFEAMADPKWQTKEAATKFLGYLATAAPEQISVSLPPGPLWQGPQHVVAALGVAANAGGPLAPAAFTSSSTLCQPTVMPALAASHHACPCALLPRPPALTRPRPAAPP